MSLASRSSARRSGATEMVMASEEQTAARADPGVDDTERLLIIGVVFCIWIPLVNALTRGCLHTQIKFNEF